MDQNKIANQQGDVILKRIKTVKGKKLTHLVLAEGEKTGHKHQIVKGDAELYEDGRTLYLRVNSDSAILAHEEHAHQVIEKGDYQIGIVKEYDHFAEEARNVAD